MSGRSPTTHSGQRSCKQLFLAFQSQTRPDSTPWRVISSVERCQSPAASCLASSTVAAGSQVTCLNLQTTLWRRLRKCLHLSTLSTCSSLVTRYYSRATYIILPRVLRSTELPQLRLRTLTNITICEDFDGSETIWAPYVRARCATLSFVALG